MHASADPLPLRDLTVLDLSLQLPGPYSTMLLHALGARVIKVEPPGGDPARTIDPRMFATVNAGKESIELDLREEQGRAWLDRLLQISDVLVEGFRPGVADRLGFGYEHVSTLRPSIVYCSISGYGQDGPYRALPGHDLNYLGVAGGADAYRRRDDQPPEPIGIPIADLAAGTTAALSIVAALRDDSGTRGRRLDIALLDAAFVWSNLKDGTAAGEPAYAVVRASDGLCLTVAVIEDKFWRALCLALGWHEWLADAELSSYEQRKLRAAELLGRLRREIARKPRAFWLETFAAADVPVAPVHSRAEAASDPQVVERQLVSDGTLRAPLPKGFGRVGGSAPALDSNRASLLAELGRSEVATTADDLAADGLSGRAEATG
jgi:crotonobetainyl-CoA:carnitine CoA-transferase CaiB-like acyl-CoA transferase